MPSDKEQKNRPKKRRKRRNILFTRKDKRETGQQGNAYKTIYPNCDLWSDIGDVCLLRFFALKPWMQQWFAGNAKTVMIPEDEQAAEDSEKIKREKKILRSMRKVMKR